MSGWRTQVGGREGSLLTQEWIDLGMHVAFLTIKDDENIPYCQHAGGGRHEYMQKTF